jgi:hypothetical protein
MPGYDRAQRKAIELDFGAADTVLTAPLPIEGLLRRVQLHLPNFTNVVTGTLQVLDEDGYEIFTTTAQAKNTVYNGDPDDGVLVAGACSLKLTLSGAPGGSGGKAIVVPWWIGAKVSF